jgi:hypothetical protein
MRKIAVLAMATAVLAGVGVARAQEGPKMPTPQKEHEWLKQLEGEWETECEAFLEPGKPAVKSTGSESVHALGAFWSIAEFKGTCPLGGPFSGVMTIGYDTQKKQYVGTWVCSMCDHLLRYEGTADGKALTLETEALNPATGKLARMRDVFEIKDKDTKVLTMSMQGENGQWIKFMTVTSRRKK